MTNLSFVSLNCRGLGDRKKRRDVLNYLHQKNFSIYCLQDTHWVPEIEPFIKAECNLNGFFNHYTTNARGVAILFANNVDYKVKNVRCDTTGNMLALSINIDNLDITLICLYGPNEDSPIFYSNIKDVISEFNDAHCVICGDWNLVLDFNLDTSNYVRINNPNARNEVLNLINDLSLCDPWREFFPQGKRFTWRQGFTVKQARLDFFLISTEHMNYVYDSEIGIKYKSDHSFITLSFRVSKDTHGRGFWKFNNSLLVHDDFITNIKGVINSIVECYAVPVYNPVNLHLINHHEIQFTIDDQLFFEVLLCAIRGACISYSVYKKRDRDKRQAILEKELEDLNKEIDECTDNDVKLANLERVKVLNSDLENIRNEMLKEVLLRSRAQWLQHGEKPSKFFLNLEKKNVTTKLFSSLNLADGSAVTGINDIKHEVYNFYKKLYQHQNCDSFNFNNLLGNTQTCKLSVEDALNLEGTLNLNEIENALRNMKNNKSPGPDGFTCEFYKAFWNDISVFLLRSLNYGYRNGILSVTQRQGAITLIPKGNKPRQFLSNWRPISLLNVS